MKKLFCILLVLTLPLPLSACKKKEYSSAVGCDELIAAVEERLPVEMGYESLDTPLPSLRDAQSEIAWEDMAARHSILSEDINEFGIFLVKDEEARRTLRGELEEYLRLTLEEKGAFIASYAPNELEKLEHARVRAIGDYVAYAILSREDGNVFFNTVEDMLSDKAQR